MISHSSEIIENFHRRTVTPVSFSGPEWKIPGTGIFFAGSCFADYMFREFDEMDLRVLNSPFGNIYNPLSLAEGAEMLAKGGPIDESGFFMHQDSVRHFMFHSGIRAQSKEELNAGLEAGISSARNFIAEACAAVLTLGTSVVYRLKKDPNRTVNNCHRLPANDFIREQISAEEAAEALQRTIRAMLKINPELKIVLSLSPVRHLRDRPEENSLSKAVLRCAVESACRSHDCVWYFPSYEIMMDELRDYRWYADDLCHPSAPAVEYIISRFIHSVFSPEFQSFHRKLLKIRKDLDHRPLDAESEEYIRFRRKAEDAERQLRKDFPAFFR